MPQSAKSKAKARGRERNSTQTETERSFLPLHRKHEPLSRAPRSRKRRRRRPCEKRLPGDLRAGPTESLGSEQGMSIEEKPDTPMYVYESTVHCANILLCLNEQRQQDVLCDVTVLVEGRKIRAHRAVLAACSQYFSLLLRAKTEHEPLISLPMITEKGFSPLLQFAYTAKLLLNRDNIQDVMHCAKFLGMHNLEDSCFRFLEAQMKSELDGIHTSQSPLSNQTQLQNHHNNKTEDAKVQLSDSKPPLFGSRLHSEMEQMKMHQSDQPQLFDLPHYPKYRKYHQVHVKHNTTTSSHSSTSSLQGSLQDTITSSDARGLDLSKVKAEPANGEDCVPLDLSELEQDGPVRDKVIEMNKEMEFDGRQLSSTPNEFPASKRSPVCLRSLVKKEVSSSDHCLSTDLQLSSRTSPIREQKVVAIQEQQVDFQKDYQAFIGGLSSKKLPDGVSLKSLSLETICSQDPEQESDRKSVIFSSRGPYHLAPTHSYPGESCLGQDTPEDLWAVSNQLFPCFQTLSPNSASQDPPLPYRRHPKRSYPVPIKMCSSSTHAESHVRTSSSCSSYSYAEDGSGGSPSSLPQFELSTSPCSTMARCLALEHQEQSTSRPPEIKCEKSYDTNSSDESGSFSDGDSESFATKERTQEVKLPFSVNQITDLSRNDFQLMIRMHKLSLDQLEFIQDIRRRSKNRIAAQRCRKRKLDCIQNLEREIHKLVCERQKLVTERSQLKTCMGELWENFSFLSNEVCREEQRTPRSQYNPHTDPVLSGTELQISLIPNSKDISDCQTTTQPPHLHLRADRDTVPSQENTASVRSDPSQTGSSSVTIDFCQEMTEKCTTEELPERN